MSSSSSVNRQIVLRQRPGTGSIDPTLNSGTFELKTSPVPSPSSLKDNQILVRLLYCSLDPAMRGWLNDARSYLPPVQIGEVMRASGLGVVVKSNSGKFKEGDHVAGTFGWQEYAVVKDSTATKLDTSTKGVELLDFLGPLGSSGQTAYWGMMDVAKLKGDGQVVVVTGAAGSVGTIAVQIAKLKGAKVIAVAGGADKCAWLKSELGADEALDYKAPGFMKEYKDLLRKKYGYIDILFDNVGGEILDESLVCLKPHAVIALCGSISQYNATDVYGLKNYMALIGMKARMEGFIVFDYANRYHEAEKVMGAWLAEGKLKRQFHVAEGGIEGLPRALTDLFKGVNKGKMVGKIASDA